MSEDEFVNVTIELKNGSEYELTLKVGHDDELALGDWDSGIIALDHQRPIYEGRESAFPYDFTRPQVVGRKPEAYFFRASEIAAVVFHSGDAK